MTYSFFVHANHDFDIGSKYKIPDLNEEDYVKNAKLIWKYLVDKYPSEYLEWKLEYSYFYLSKTHVDPLSKVLLGQSQNSKGDFGLFKSSGLFDFGKDI